MAIAIGSLSAAATAGAVVPPGNSAANQYTETYPTWRGNAPTGEESGKSPKQALGARNAGRLQKLGPEGRAAAQLAAETAPGSSAAAVPGSGAPGTQGASGQGAAGGSGRGASVGSASNPAGNGGGGVQPEGSSALGEVLKQATGSSSTGEMGLLLPLIILGAIAFAATYSWRRRRRPA